MTSPESFTECPLTLEVDGVRIPAVLTLPANADPVSAVLLLPGSLFIDVDGNYPTWGVRPNLYAELARQLAARGHAVLRHAKTGPGTGSEVIDPVRAAEAFRHFSQRVVISRAALRALRESLGEPAERIRIWITAGHSEGAVVASLLAADEPSLDGFVSLSGPSTGLLDIMRDQMAGMPGISGDLSAFDEAAARIRRGEPLPPEAAQNPQTAMLAQMDPKGMDYIREVDAVDPTQAWAAVDRPLLLVQGGRDLSVPEKHVHRIREARGSRPTELAVFPELQHFYKQAEPGMDPQASFSLSTETDPRVAEAMDGWIRRLAGREPENAQ
jgi:alpha-beta hydrolase superfamily lysophospholipase